MVYNINSNNYIMNTTKLLVKIGKKIFLKIGLLDNKKPNQNFRIPEKFWFGYGSPLCQLEISGIRTEFSFRWGTRTTNAPK